VEWRRPGAELAPAHHCVRGGLHAAATPTQTPAGGSGPREAREGGRPRGTPTGMGSGALSRLAELPAVHETGHQDRPSGGGQLEASVSYGPSGLRGYQIDAPQEPPSRSRADHRPRDGPRSGGGSGEPTPSTPGGSFPSARNGRT
jgi:hypothetical protein